MLKYIRWKKSEKSMSSDTIQCSQMQAYIPLTKSTSKISRHLPSRVFVFKMQQILIYKIMMHTAAAIARSVQWLEYETEYGRIVVRFQVEARLSSFPEPPHCLWCPPSLPFSVYQRVFSQRIKRPRREAEHLHPLPALRLRGATPPVHHMHSWRSQRQLHFT
jgi:hypothetical protein